MLEVPIWLAICPHDYTFAEVVVCSSKEEAEDCVREWKDDDDTSSPYVRQETIDVPVAPKAFLIEDDFGCGLDT
jgi:hypothetical protein